MFIIGNLKDCVWESLYWEKKWSVEMFRSSIKGIFTMIICF